MKKQTEIFENLPYDSEEFKEAWNDWVKHREWMKEPLSPMAIKRQFRFLLAMGEKDAIRSIDNSINNNWTGLFPVKAEQIEQTSIIAQWKGKKYGQ
jgi:hypothetical protein